jgi:hypothetical protein
MGRKRKQFVSIEALVLGTLRLAGGTAGTRKLEDWTGLKPSQIVSALFRLRRKGLVWKAFDWTVNENRRALELPAETDVPVGACSLTGRAVARHHNTRAAGSSPCAATS